MESEHFYSIFSKLSEKNLNEEFIIACVNGNLVLVKYLLTSQDLKLHADIHASEDKGFQYVCNFNHLNIVEFFIFEMNIEKTKYIKRYLQNNPNSSVEKMFEIRDLNQKLEYELNSDKIIQKKIKV